MTLKTFKSKYQKKKSKYLLDGQKSSTQGTYTHELNVSVRACTRPSKFQVRQNPSIERQGWYEVQQLIAAGKGGANFKGMTSQ